jgi:DNA-binding IclR family transcriptional regulator
MIAVEGAQAVEAVLVNLVQRIREEFEEAPDLRLTVREAARFWGLDETTCGRVLEQLLAVGFLATGGDGRYRQMERLDFESRRERAL